MSYPIKKERLTTKAKARFWSKVNKTSGCWNWRASRDSHGYGRFSLNGRGAGPVAAHRVSWVLEHGEIDGAEVCHSCDNPACVNPNHLFIGTHSENMKDAQAKGRMKIKSKGKPGSRHSLAKLTEMQVLEMRKMKAAGVKNRRIAEFFGVCYSAAQKITTGKLWKHVTH